MIAFASDSLNQFLKSTPLAERLQVAFLQVFADWLNDVQRNAYTGKFVQINSAFQIGDSSIHAEYVSAKFNENLSQVEPSSIFNKLPWELEFEHFDLLSSHFQVGLLASALFLNVDLSNEEELVQFLSDERDLHVQFPQVEKELLKAIYDLTKVERTERSDSLNGLKNAINKLINAGNAAINSGSVYDYVLTSFQNHLLDFSARNPLFQFKSGANSLVFEDLNIFEKGKLVVKSTDPDYSVLNKLRLKAKNLEREIGSSELKLAVGLLNWQNNGQVFRSPFSFANAELIFKKGIEPSIEVSFSNTELEINSLLRFYFNQHFNWHLGNEILLSSTNVFAQCNAELNKATEGTKADFTIENKFALGIFNQSSAAIVNDYSHIIGAKESSLISKLIEKDASEVELNNDLNFESNFSVLPFDPSQLQVINQSIGQTSFCVEGPPGTGKSQTIVNLIANYVANGKKVLFVSEKRAAVDVVWNKLQSVGLHHAAIKSHNQKAEQKELLEHIQLAMEALSEPLAMDMQGHRRVSA
ncbi:MAG: DUF4011 domain-containing protein, partial [Bacteroidetes bacterium]|nr:DUF4011 domain-containing protein [Bacteroidota bacterium]